MARPVLRLALLALAAALLLAAAPRAHAYVYWTSLTGDSIGRANLDGTGVDPDFLPAANPCGVAVDDTYIYWVNSNGTFGTIGRARLDGTDIDQNFTGPANNGCGIAVDDDHIWWANSGVGGTTVARADKDDGANVLDVVTGLNRPRGVAVDDTHVFWGGNIVPGVGRALLNGALPDQSHATVLGMPVDVALTATHLYWADRNGRVGRANLDGTGEDSSFITGGDGTTAVAVHGGRLYWANEFGDSIGRANLDGTGVDQNFIADLDGPTGVAVDALAPPPPPPPPPAPPAPAVPAPVAPPPGPPAPPPGGGGSENEPGAPAKLRVLRARVRRGRLDILAQITRRATGKLELAYRSAGQTTRFDVDLDEDGARTARAGGGRLVRIDHRLDGKQRGRTTGIVRISYDGDDRVREDSVRLRAARNPARLRRTTTRIDSRGRLVVGGTISRRARGVVRIRMDYVTAGGEVEELRFRARIRVPRRGDARWRIVEELPSRARQVGGQLSIQYTGYGPRHIRGEQTSKQVRPAEED